MRTRGVPDQPAERQPHRSALVPDGGAGRVDYGRPLEHGEDLNWLVLMLGREGHLERVAHGVAGRDYGGERKELNSDSDYAATSDGQFLIGGLIVLASPPKRTTTRQLSKLGCHSSGGMSSDRPVAPAPCEVGWRLWSTVAPFSRMYRAAFSRRPPPAQGHPYLLVLRRCNRN